MQALGFFLINILVYNGRNKFVMLSTFPSYLDWKLPNQSLRIYLQGPISCGLALEAVLGAGLQMWRL